MIDLDRFSEPIEVVLPIVDKWGIHNGRRIRSNVEDGWYVARLGDRTKIQTKAQLTQVRRSIQAGISRGFPVYTIYILGGEGIPINFDTFLRSGFTETEPINFLSLPLFETAQVVLWEDKRLYFYDHIMPKNRETIRHVKSAFESGATLQNVRGVTPELRYYFLLACLQRESFNLEAEFARWNLSTAERSKRISTFRQSFPNRLSAIVSKAGGKFIGYNKLGKGFLVEWEVGGQIIKSHIKDDMRIVSAGFCLSGDDKRHTVASIVNLAKLFQERKPLYITRE